MNSQGVTDTENIFVKFCEKTFSPVFVYPNPYKNDKSAKEVCDALVIFDRHIIIFFDRRKPINSKSDKQMDMVEWKRWLRKTIKKQTETAYGAEKWLLGGNKVFTDQKLSEQISLPYDINLMKIHRVIVAHGSEKACLEESDDNYYGSLAIAYSDDRDPFNGEMPFSVTLSKDKPVHIFDSANLNIIMKYLDTPTDFIKYLISKEDYLGKHKILSYAGEEDLLAHYLQNIDENNQHYIGVIEQCDGLGIAQGLWKEFATSKVYKSTTKANKISYFWDDLLKKMVSDKCIHQSKPTKDLSELVFAMSQPDRVTRRGNSEQIQNAITNFPREQFDTRHILFLQSENSGVAYVVLLLPFMQQHHDMSEYIEKRTTMLKTACVIAMSRYSCLDVVVGIVLNPVAPFEPSPDIWFMMLESQSLNQDQIDQAIENNKRFNFFETGQEEKMFTPEFVNEHQ